MVAPPQRTTRFCLVLLVIAAASPPPALAYAASHTIRAKEIEADLRAGRPVLQNHAVVTGEVVLRGIGTVAVPFRCRRCTFKKGIVASDTVFESSVDLSGSTIKGPALFRGTTFHGPAVFAVPVEDESACSPDTT